MNIPNEFYLRYHRPKRSKQIASVYLGEAIQWQDGECSIRPRWSHAIHPVVGRRGDFVLLQGTHGVFGRKREQVRIAA